MKRKELQAFISAGVFSVAMLAGSSYADDAMPSNGEAKAAQAASQDTSKPSADKTAGTDSSASKESDSSKTQDQKHSASTDKDAGQHGCAGAGGCGGSGK